MIKSYKITNVCPSCAFKVEKALKKLKGVREVKISVFSERLTLTLTDEISEDIFDDIRKTCKKIEPDCVLSNI
ncbi:MAG: cation transporter [Eubacteriales bacterium]|nr:cation transporter [Eubacteriales bacterium]MDD4421758.1 cation transporter [Eubacteriales bacterium]